MLATTLVVFALVYAGMLLGRLPRLKLDRTGIALLGAIALLASGALELDAVKAAIDVPTLALLFGLMVMSAQLRLSGFYSRIARGLAELPLGPAGLLAALTLAEGLLSAVFSNDIICLAIAPVLIATCARRRLDPLPLLLGLACASNVGSAATLIGNPQNMLIGQRLGLSFTGYLASALPPALAGLAATWGIIAYQWRGRWQAETAAAARPTADELDARSPAFDGWQTGKGLGVATLVMLAFLFTPWPREVVALAGAGLLLTSRQLHSRQMLGLVDWQLLVLFASLFVVDRALALTGVPEQTVAALAASGIHLAQPAWLMAVTVLLSNAVSNVPAVMLLLPLAQAPGAGALLALSSTLAGNLLLIGSIANLIVADAAAEAGIAIDWRRHARTGVPVTLATLAIASAWLWLS